jgi:hypothetical protein
VAHDQVAQRKEVRLRKVVTDEVPLPFELKSGRVVCS